MRIAYLSKSSIPSKAANSVHVMKMCQALAKEGCDVTLYCTRSNNDVEDVFAYYGVEKCFRLSSVKLPNVKFGTWLYAYGIRRHMMSEKLPDIVYGRHLLSLLSLAGLSIPFIYEAHTPPQSKTQEFMVNRLIRSTNFRFLVTISEALKKEYMKIYPGLREENILVLHDGADVPTTVDKMESSLVNEPHEFNIGYVGHMYQGRGIELIVELAQIFPDITFHLVGGEDKDIAMWKNKGVTDNLVFHGHVPNGRLGSYYERFDVMIAPYQHKIRVSGGKGDTSKWMSPLKIFEYMAFRKAMIVSDIPVLREVLSPNDNCLLCDPSSVRDWVESIELLRKDSGFRDRLAGNAYRDLKKHFSWKKRAQSVVENIHV